MKTFDLNDLLGQPDMASNDYIENPIFTNAALRCNFNINKDFKEFDESEIDLLEKHSVKKEDGTSQLRESDLKYVLNNLFENKEAYKANLKLNPSDNQFSRIIFEIIDDKPVSLESLSENELFYYGKSIRLLPNKEDNINELKAFLERKQFFKKFENQTKNFAGRKKNLRDLKDYVDWLPKETLFSIIANSFRNIIDWHQKRPLFIKGIGGIGKSTLISKFIIDHSGSNKKNESLPFIYIDFDLPGFSIEEPVNILIEGLRQLSLQFPDKKNLFKSVSNEISITLSHKHTTNLRSTNKYSRDVLFQTIKEKYLDVYSSTRKLQLPILMIFDSFEEMQYRASHTNLVDFFQFVKAISESVPRLRPVFVGRGDVDESILDFKFQEMPIEGFDSESADSILKQLGVNQEKSRKAIYSKVGGNPLILHLAASLYNKDPDFIFRENIHGHKEIQEYLVGRIMNQIHDDRARKLAIPGLVVRRINPEIIQKILAKPCGLTIGELSLKDAKDIFDALKRESFLMQNTLQDTADEFAFRQDLRMACEEMVIAKFSDKVAEIHKAAVLYYEHKRLPKDIAEYIYHELKLNPKKEELDLKRDYVQYEEYLKESSAEFEENTQVNIKNIYGSKASLELLSKAGSNEVANYYVRQIYDSLVSDFANLINVEKEIDSTSLLEKYLENIDFLLTYSLLKQRLNKIGHSIQLVEDRIRQMELPNAVSSNMEYVKCLILLTENLCYEFKYEQALSVITNADKAMDENPKYKNSKPDQEYAFLQLKIRFFMGMIHCRMNEKSNTSLQNYFISDPKEFQGILDYISLEPIAAKWFYIFNVIFTRAC